MHSINQHLVRENARRVFERFESIVLCNLAGDLRKRFITSPHTATLWQNGPFILDEIAEYLHSIATRTGYGGYESEEDIRRIWVWIVRDIAREMGALPPEKGCSLPELAAWTRENALKKSA